MFWYFEKDELVNTPSLKDGIDSGAETRFRMEGVYFIRNMGKKINLGYNTIATAVTYFHRFYMAHSFNEFPLYVTASSCLFLAGKAEETPKRSKDLLKAAWELFDNDEGLIIERFGETPRENIMKCESVLLQTVNFEFDIEHPYKYLLKYAKYLKGDKVKLQTILQMAWNFLNDSLRTTLCLQWEPEVIAIALIHVSSKLCSFKIVDWRGRKQKHKQWWDLFIEDFDNEILEDIGNQILDLYSDSKTASTVVDSPDSIESSEPRPGSAASSPTESNSVNLEDANEMTTSTITLLPGLPAVDLSVPPPGMFSLPPIVDMSVPPPVNVFVPPPVQSVHLAGSEPVGNLPPPINKMLPISVNLSVPPPMNFSVPPPNFPTNKACNFNVSSPLLAPVQAFKQKINYSCFSTPDSPFNNHLYSTQT